ncbi:1-deoxy-D-xylulose-5-phosphate reductoisomerase [Pseudomarimonas arenosa]|uniref:1-deoxy-D-xylulose 5-phosphate reductoisomerase n=1 Tax=Pseudomarimonas arenosa TaxID=2774145 RepID=A0AAW3ZPY7_9GAMM|nr:1-deoxy-D-xylulose-5-phosphate reductoisomerase [Pseudomarimonas arenosa]MBD8527229.1 1-deoxy-D-xylulose-5-phosphate reductoisomerase [Pseudomarimonas arenosa]
MTSVAVLGATGSIGRSALDVISRHPQRYRPYLLSAGQQVDKLIELCAEHRPRHALIADATLFSALRAGLSARGLSTEAHAGPVALAELMADPACDTVIAAIVGAAGMPSALAAARAGKRILLANKESVVMAGDLLRAALDEGGGELLPVDSEHNAIFQCLPTGSRNAGLRPDIRRIVLTASGGPFRGRSRDSLREVTVEQACAHPNWSMGQKISVDSASLMNKGLEVIEAHWLFNLRAEQIEVVVHPQSIVHSLVHYIDGSTLAQLGNPDMRTALAYGLAWPERIDAGVAELDLVRLSRLDFEAPDLQAFPCLRLAFEALRHGIGGTTVLNAANEVAVSAFLQRQLGFLDIAEVIESTLNAVSLEAGSCVETRLQLDQKARQWAQADISRRK